MSLSHFEDLLPREFEAALKAFPVAFVPWGALEWHGQHLALGLDGIKAQAIAEQVAAKTGGIVVPPVWLGHFTLKLPENGSFPYTLEFRRETIQAVLTDYLTSLADAGFKLIVVLCGHYGPPHTAALTEAAQRFAIFEKRTTTRVWILPDYELVSDLGYMGDHAARWETSILMHLRPDLVDLSRLNDDNASEAGGILLGEDPRGATAEQGANIVQHIVERLAAKVTAFIERGHE